MAIKAFRSNGVRFYLIGLIFLAPQAASPLFAVPAPVIIDESFRNLDLGKNVEYYVDKTNSLNVEDVEKIPDEQWLKPDKGRMNFWESDDVFWFRFVIDNHLVKAQSMVLLVDYAPLDHVFFYEKISDGNFDVQKRGDHHIDRSNIGDTWHPVLILQPRRNKKKNIFFGLNPAEILSGCLQICS